MFKKVMVAEDMDSINQAVAIVFKGSRNRFTPESSLGIRFNCNHIKKTLPQPLVNSLIPFFNAANSSVAFQ